MYIYVCPLRLSSLSVSPPVVSPQVSLIPHSPRSTSRVCGTFHSSIHPIHFALLFLRPPLDALDVPPVPPAPPAPPFSTTAARFPFPFPFPAPFGAASFVAFFAAAFFFVVAPPPATGSPLPFRMNVNTLSEDSVLPEREKT